MKYLFHPDELKTRVTQDQTGLEFISCQRLEFSREHPCEIVTSGVEELALIVIAGQVTYDCAERRGAASFRDVLYVPWHARVTLQADPGAVVMCVGSPSDRDTEFAHLAFRDVAQDPARHKMFGSAEAGSLRDVYMIIDDQFPAARLLVGMAEGRPGGWTAWPPHEHAAEREEMYVYFDMGQGFGIQCVYETMDDAHCLLVREGDMVPVVKGFHPSVGCPAGRLSYVYIMASKIAGQRTFMSLQIQPEYGTRLE